ncbi:SubName: Full=Uncharacterized protein {ECO:0000313/EMBL:CCA69590.1} [Serendipita indica DSM 11827]|nr:SubName: Full=Uncharacterized protein {ECO:0000313/EMBL:CCA69590.1} [Serendipita indica DSM 11827]
MALWLLWFIYSWCTVLSTALTLVEDTDSSIQYSNSGPSWRYCFWHNGGGRAGDGWHGINMSQMSMVGWHEAYGAGASVSFTFTGTRVMLTGGLCKYFWPLTLNIFIDDQQIDTFTYNPPINTSAVISSDWNYGVTIYDAQNLTPGQHTFKATSVGANTLFTVDTIQYEPSIAGTSSASSVGILQEPYLSLLCQYSMGTGSMSNTQSITSGTQLPVPTDGFTSIVSQMDIQPSDPRIIYHPQDAWTMEQSTKRAPTCLSGAMYSNTTGSSLTFNFTASAIQLYTVSGSSGGRFRVTIDGEDKGTFDTYDAASNFTDCRAAPLVTLTGLDSAQHTVVLTVEDSGANTNRTSIEFAGFRVTAATVNSPVGTITSSSKPKISVILGGVIGAIALVVIFILAVLFLKKGRVKEKEMNQEPIQPEQPEPQFTQPFNIPNALVSDSSGANLLVDRPPVPYKGQGRVMHEPTTSTYTPGGSGQGSSYLTSEDIGETPEYRQEGPSHITSGYPESVSSSQVTLPAPVRAPTSWHVPVPASQSNDNDGVSTLDRRTYYTLPSYHERVMEGAGGRGRNLSEADINAISQRLREVMHQSGGLDLEPPHELIDHLVEEQLREE